MTRPEGLFTFTCASTGRPEHGTRRSGPQDAPLLMEQGDWGDYYKNLTEEDIRETLFIYGGTKLDGYLYCKICSERIYRLAEMDAEISMLMTLIGQ